MATFGTLKRNLKRNIHPYNEVSVDVPGLTTRLVSFFLAFLLAVAVPVMAITAAANLTLRIPDLYSFDLTRTESLMRANLTVENGDVSTLISDYMMHKVDAFQMTAEYQGRQQPVFSIGDGAAMQKLRRQLDRTLPAPPIGLLLLAAGILVLCRLQRFRLLRRAYLASWVLYLILLGLLAFELYYGNAKTQVWEDVLGIRPGTADILPTLFGNGFFLSAFIVVSAVSLVVMVVGNSITFALTRNRQKMF
jgi:hypothetical protein